MSRNRKNSNSSADGAIAMILLALVALPIVGLYLTIKGRTEDDKATGIIMLVISAVIFVVMLVYSMR